MPAIERGDGVRRVWLFWQALQSCAACHKQIERGQAYTTAALGPGMDPEERKRAREGKEYNPIRVALHWACATGEEDV